MAKEMDGDEFHLTLRGGGLSLDRKVSEAVAQHIVAVVMGGSAASTPATPLAGGFGLGSTAQAGTPKAFLAQKRPATDIERVTCLAWYLDKARSTPSFKTKELTKLNQEAAQPKLSNVSATARNAVSDGLLAPSGGGQKQITARGEALVDALPDRERVKAALELHPKKKRKPSIKKAKR